MKKIVLVLAVLLLGNVVTSAQEHRRPGMNPRQTVEQRVQRLDKELTLTEEQKAEITRIYTEEQESMRKAMSSRKEQGAQGDESMMKAHREKMQSQREATDAKVKSLLTPEQASKYDQLKQRQGRRGGHHKGAKGPKGNSKKPQECEGNCQCCEKEK